MPGGAAAPGAGVPGSAAPGSAPGGWVLRADVPDGVFSLGVEWDDATAAAEHEAFADRCMPLLRRAAPASQSREDTRASLLAQLAWLRRAVAGSGLAYLGVMAAKNGDRVALILLAAAAARLEFPAGIDAASLLAAMLRHQYPDADVEEFDTPHGAAAGLRRLEAPGRPDTLPATPGRTGPAGREGLTAGVAQALVPFPDAAMVGAVTGYSFAAEDVDLAAVFTAVMACRMRTVPAGGCGGGRNSRSGRR